jgi:hypothetical protein
MSFRSVAQWAASPDSGKYHVTTFRKQVASATTLANDYIDYTYFAGNPPANFYASAPLELANVSRDKGLNVPNRQQYVKSLTVMSGAASATSTTNANQLLLLCDYLLYVPFIDTDAVGETQLFTGLAVPERYADGRGVKLMAVSQSASSTVGQFTVEYTNQDGTAEKVTQNTFTKVVSGGGTLVSSSSSVIAGTHNFVNLAAGDTGVRSIQSVTFTAAGGGLMALVLVKPLWQFYSTQECRRTTSSTLESFGAATQFEAVIHKPTVEILPGAVLGIVGRGNVGSLASSNLVGTLETIWS